LPTGILRRLDFGGAVPRQRVPEQGDVRGAIISNACGSSAFSPPARRSRRPRGNSRSITTPCVGTGSIMFQRRLARHISRAPAPPKISSRRSSRTNLSPWSTITASFAGRFTRALARRPRRGTAALWRCWRAVAFAERFRGLAAKQHDPAARLIAVAQPCLGPKGLDAKEPTCDGSHSNK